MKNDWDRSVLDAATFLESVVELTHLIVWRLVNIAHNHFCSEFSPPRVSIY